MILGQRTPNELPRAVKRRREMRERWRRDGERSMGRNLAMIGVLGWTVLAPTLLGIFAGRWLDRRFHSGLFWTLGLFAVGLAMGCVLGWKWIERQ